MASGGAYRIDAEEFPAPITEWSVQVIGPKLNGLPALNSYYIHTWTWPSGGIEACDMERLLNKFYEQNASGQLGALETDPHDADEALEHWGTRIYSDFIIQAVTPVRREFPQYANVTVTFEVYVS